MLLPRRFRIAFRNRNGLDCPYARPTYGSAAYHGHEFVDYRWHPTQGTPRCQHGRCHWRQLASVGACPLRGPVVRDDVDTDLHALVANDGLRPRDQLACLVLALVAERAVQALVLRLLCGPAFTLGHRSPTVDQQSVT